MPQTSPSVSAFDNLLANGPPGGAPGAVPPPSSPPVAQQQAAPAAPSGGSVAMFDNLLANPPAPAAPTPQASSESTPTSSAPPNTFRRMGASPDMANNPNSDVAAEFLGSVANGAASLPEMAGNAAIRGLNDVFGSKIPQMQPPVAMGAPSESSRLIQGAGQAVGSLLPGEGAGLALKAAAPAGSLLGKVGGALSDVPSSALPAVAASGVAQQGAADAMPENSPWKTPVGIAAGLAGGLGAGALQAGIGGAARVTGDALGGIGLTPKDNYSAGLPEGQSIRATPAQAQFAADRIRAAGGAGLEPALNNGPMEVVPGEQPTLSQIHPAPNLVKLEKAARLNPADHFGSTAFQQADQAKNAAFVAHLEQQNPGITQALGNAFVERASDLASQQQQAAQSGLEAVQGATRPLGANVEPTVTGSLLRESGLAQHAAQKAQDTDTFWSQVPNDLTHTAIPAKSMADIFMGNQRINIPPDSPPELLAKAQQIQKFVHDPQYSPPMPPAEEHMLQQVAALPSDIPYQGTAKLLSGISAAKAQLTQQGLGQSPSMARLRMIEGSLQDSMAGQAQTDMATGRIPLSQEGSEQGSEALNAARQASAITNQRFTRGAVGQALAPAPYGDFKVHNLADVAKLAISGNAQEPQRVGEWLDALRADPNGQQALRDALISDANRRGVIQPNGTVNMGQYGKFMTPDRVTTLKQFPGLYEQFQNASGLQQQMDAQNGAAAAQLKNYQSGVAQKFLGGDPGAVVRQAITTRDRGQSLAAIADAVKGNPDAEAALRAHLVDETVQKFAPEWSAPAGQANGKLKGASFRQFLQEYKPGLVKILGGQGMQNFDAVRAGLQRAQEGAPAVGGSQTAPNNLLATMLNVGRHHGMGIGSASSLALLGDFAMEHGTHGLMAAGATAGAGMILSALKGAAIHSTNDLVNAMVLHPEFAKTMLQQFKPQQSISAAMAARLAASIRGTLSSQVGSGGQPGLSQ